MPLHKCLDIFMTKAKAPLGVKWFVEAPNLGLKGMAQKIGTKLGNIV